MPSDRGCFCRLSGGQAYTGIPSPRRRRKALSFHLTEVHIHRLAIPQPCQVLRPHAALAVLFLCRFRSSRRLCESCSGSGRRHTTSSGAWPCSQDCSSSSTICPMSRDMMLWCRCPARRRWRTPHPPQAGALSRPTPSRSTWEAARTVKTAKTADTGSNTLQSRPRESRGGRLRVRHRCRIPLCGRGNADLWASSSPPCSNPDETRQAQRRHQGG